MNALDKKIKTFWERLRNSNFSPKDILKIKSAYNFAYKKHGDQLRKSGEPYIIHPLETAIYLFEWKMEVETIITGLLHDVLEDTDCTEEEMEKKFGWMITEMVKTVSKVSKISDQNRSKEKIKYDDNNEYLIKVLLSISTDIRPMMVKIADRLHNMQTIHYLKKEKQERIANETFNIYANIAGRLGLYHQKTQLLDLSFSILEPKKYEKLKKELDELVLENKEKLKSLKEEIENILKNNLIDCQVVERIKGVYSTYKKHERGIDLKDIHDIFALRIIGEYSELKCYEILGMIHLNFTQMPKTFKDYISNPKLNLYQSLHTTITYKKILFEIQIRNVYMDEAANIGIAAHWHYKENTEEIKNIKENLIKDIIEKKNSGNIQKLKYVSRTNIFDVLLMNNAKWYIMNENSTALDLAYLYDPSKIFYISRITKEGTNISLWDLLRKNDIITIDYSEKEQAKYSWIDYTTIEKCKLLFKNLKKPDTKEKIEKDFINKLKESLSNNIASDKDIQKRLLMIEFNSLMDFINFFKDKQDIDKKIIYTFFEKNKKWKKSYEFLSLYKTKNSLDSLSIKNIPGLNFEKVIFTSCCSKVPGMDIVGILIQNKFYIHKSNCSNIDKTKKKIILQWNEEKLQEFPKLFKFSFTLSFNKETMKTNKIIHIVTGQGFEILAVNTKIESNGTTIVKFLINCYNYLSIIRLLDNIESRFDFLNIMIN